MSSFDVDQRFQSVADIEAFYRNPTHDMTLRSDAHAFARANPAAAKRVSYYAAEQIERSRYARRDVAAWRYLFAELGGASKWRPQFQKRGTCVGQGAKLGCDTLMAINRRFGGGRFPGRSSVASNYAGSRVDIGRQPGRWDGSTGFWVVRWMVEYGIVTLAELSLADDALDTDERLAVDWTASNQGVPTEYEAIAREKPVGDSWVVETPDEVAAVLDAGGVVLICSTLIATGRRGKYGISPLENAGGHCQLVWGKHYTPEGDRVWNEQNSWSADWGSGQVFPDDMPPGSVNLTDRDLARQLRSGDCHALVGVRGLEWLDDDDLIIF